MQIITDLQIHSKYSRAVSQQMVIPQIWQWAKTKGIGLMATGDWTHPLWMREIKANLEETGKGLLKLKSVKDTPGVAGWNDSGSHDSPGVEESGPHFLLATEVSSIYSQGGKGRRVHTLIWTPTLDSADKITKELIKRGANLHSDGRPIIGLSSIEVAELVFSIDPTSLIIPAHCLLPDSFLIGKDNKSKAIKDFKKGDLVLTHKGRYQKVEEVLSRNYKGTVYNIRPWYFRPGLTVTSEHPFLAIKTLKKCPSTGDICRPSKSHLRLCKRKTCLEYKREWVIASQLEIGDVLVYPRQKEVVKKEYLHISQMLSGFDKDTGMILNGGSRGGKIPDKINISADFGRLIGYYLSEGYTDNRDSISFCFNREEKQYIDNVKLLMGEFFGIHKCREYHRKNTQSTELIFFSKILSKWFAQICYFDPQVKKAHTKQIPDFLLQTRYNIQAEIIRGWFRGDKGYTSSRVLMNQFKMLFVRLGVIPSVLIDAALSHKRRGNHGLGNRDVTARHDSFYFSNLSFFDDKFDLKKEITRSQTKSSRRHGWVDSDYIYLPIKEIEKTKYEGKVYNLEVENDHSYTTEFVCVHNCWTPWFSMYGSKSGFDSIDECFGPFAKNIYAIETGLSSDPSMNWRIKELDDRSIVSFSDAHSGPKLGREATVFEIEELGYRAIREAIIGSVRKIEDRELKVGVEDRRSKIENTNPSSIVNPQPLSSTFNHLPSNHISYTIEFYPEEGKYHYTGHRDCGIKQTPEETKQKGTICPVCGRKLTVGVMHRVEELAGRSEEDLKIENGKLKMENGTDVQMIKSTAFPDRPPFVKLVPLQEIIAEVFGGSPTAQKTQDEYNKLVSNFGSEFKVLLETSIEDITKISGPKIADALHKVRTGDIFIDPGYDGVFGKVKIQSEEKKQGEENQKEQMSLF